MNFSPQYGVDIGATRSDDLDKLFFEEITKHKNPKVLNIGSGNVSQTRQMRETGATITSVDVIDYSKEYQEVRQMLGGIEFVHTDALIFLKTISDNTYDLACAQRMIHYLSYPQARLLLKEIRRTTKHSLYISVTGLESAIGIEYGDKNEEISERFSVLLQKEQQKFHITEPVCLYTQKEFQKLIVDSGWQIEKIWTSAFGNHKAVCLKKQE